MADDVLHSGVRCVTDLIIMPGLINLDFADINTTMKDMGKAMMGTGEASGENRAIRAAESAISNPLLDNSSIKGALGVLINITGGMDMTLFEVDAAANRIREEISNPEANIIFGSTFNKEMDFIRVSVVATGIDHAKNFKPAEMIKENLTMKKENPDFKNQKEFNLNNPYSTESHNFSLDSKVENPEKYTISSSGESFYSENFYKDDDNSEFNKYSEPDSTNEENSESVLGKSNSEPFRKISETMFGNDLDVNNKNEDLKEEGFGSSDIFSIPAFLRRKRDK
jgi:cell division protein FtsZ